MGTRDEVMTLIGPGADGDRVDVILSVVGRRFSAFLKGLGYAGDVPEALSYIVTEVAVARYNRLGSEGMSSESVEGHAATYTDDFKRYEPDILAWLDPSGTDGKARRGVIRTL